MPWCVLNLHPDCVSVAVVSITLITLKTRSHGPSSSKTSKVIPTKSTLKLAIFSFMNPGE